MKPPYKSKPHFKGVPNRTRLCLRDLCGGYHTFHGRFVRLGFDRTTGEKTVLLRRVCIGSHLLTDHLWLKCHGRAEWRECRVGDVVEVVAQPAPYLKGRPYDADNPQRIDYTLGGVRSIKVVKRR